MLSFCSLVRGAACVADCVVACARSQVRGRDGGRVHHLRPPVGRLHVRGGLERAPEGRHEVDGVLLVLGVAEGPADDRDRPHEHEREPPRDEPLVRDVRLHAQLHDRRRARVAHAQRGLAPQPPPRGRCGRELARARLLHLEALLLPPHECLRMQEPRVRARVVPRLDLLEHRHVLLLGMMMGTAGLITVAPSYGARRPQRGKLYIPVRGTYDAFIYSSRA